MSEVPVLYLLQLFVVFLLTIIHNQILWCKNKAVEQKLKKNIEVLFEIKEYFRTVFAVHESILTNGLRALYQIQFKTTRHSGQYIALAIWMEAGFLSDCFFFCLPVMGTPQHILFTLFDRLHYLR